MNLLGSRDCGCGALARGAVAAGAWGLRSSRSRRAGGCRGWGLFCPQVEEGMWSEGSHPVCAPAATLPLPWASYSGAGGTQRSPSQQKPLYSASTPQGAGCWGGGVMGTALGQRAGTRAQAGLGMPGGTRGGGCPGTGC